MSTPANIKDWATPAGLTPAVFGTPEFNTPKPDDTASAQQPENKEQNDAPFDTKKLMLGLLGDQLSQSNPAMGTVLGLLNGEKPDMLSLLPLIMNMTKKKAPAPEKNLDDYKIV